MPIDQNSSSDSEPSSDNKFNSGKGSSSDMHWYLVASKPRQELRAGEHLDNQGIQNYCPTVKVEKIRRGKKHIVTEALFTSYLFIHISSDNPLWHKVRSTRGIRDWVRFGGEIAKLPNQLVEELIKNGTDPENEVVISCFERGAPVQILSGPFSGLKAIYDKPDGESRSMLLVEFLGQINSLNVANEQIITD